MFADCFLLRDITIKLTGIYGSGSQSIYWYTKGWNLRAAVAWGLGVWPFLPGLAQRAVAQDVWPGWTMAVPVVLVPWVPGFGAGLPFVRLCVAYAG